MAQPEQPSNIRFDRFELDLRTRELRKDGRPIKLQDQPVKLLALLAGRAGELVTRPEIEKALWGEDEFVEFEHAINTAMRKIREALGEDLEKPRFIETLPRKGYRFIAPVEMDSSSGAATRPQPGPVASARGLREKIPVPSGVAAASKPSIEPGEIAAISQENLPYPSPETSSSHAATEPPGLDSGGTALQAAPPAASQFALPRSLARRLFLTIQSGYLAMYAATLYKAETVEDILATIVSGPSVPSLPVVLVLAMCGIAVRMYLLTSVGLDHPEAGVKYRRLFPLLFIFDTIWATAPLLLIRKLGLGLALGSIAALAYLPFAQRTLMESVYPATEPGNRGKWRF